MREGWVHKGSDFWLSLEKYGEYRLTATKALFLYLNLCLGVMLSRCDSVHLHPHPFSQTKQRWPIGYIQCTCS